MQVFVACTPRSLFCRKQGGSRIASRHTEHTGDSGNDPLMHIQRRRRHDGTPRVRLKWML